MIEELVRQVNSLQKQIDDLVKPEVGRWVSWTPTITQSVAVTVRVVYARYNIVNNIVSVYVALETTSAGTITNAIVIGGQPTSIYPAYNLGQGIIGSAVIHDAGTTVYTAALAAKSSTDWRMFVTSNGNYAGITPNFALANGDYISFYGVYKKL